MRWFIRSKSSHCYLVRGSPKRPKMFISDLNQALSFDSEAEARGFAQQNDMLALVEFRQEDV